MSALASRSRVAPGDNRWLLVVIRGHLGTRFTRPATVVIAPLLLCSRLELQDRGQQATRPRH